MTDTGDTHVVEGAKTGAIPHMTGTLVGVAPYLFEPPYREVCMRFWQDCIFPLIVFMIAEALLFPGSSSTSPSMEVKPYDLKLKYGDGVFMIDPFYGDCRGVIVDRAEQLTGPPHYFARFKCKTGAEPTLDWTVYMATAGRVKSGRSQ